MKEPQARHTYGIAQLFQTVYGRTQTRDEVGVLRYWHWRVMKRGFHRIGGRHYENLNRCLGFEHVFFRGMSEYLNL